MWRTSRSKGYHVKKGNLGGIVGAPRASVLRSIISDTKQNLKYNLVNATQAAANSITWNASIRIRRL